MSNKNNVAGSISPQNGSKVSGNALPALSIERGSVTCSFYPETAAGISKILEKTLRDVHLEPDELALCQALAGLFQASAIAAELRYEMSPEADTGMQKYLTTLGVGQLNGAGQGAQLQNAG